MKFSQRHIGVSSSEEKYMLDYLGLDNLDSLIYYVGEREFIGIMLARMNREIKITVSEGDSKMVKYQYI